MANNYRMSFGAPEGEPSDELRDLSCEILNVFRFDASTEKNVEEFERVINESGLILYGNEKAQLVEMAFHDANENFYDVGIDEPGFDFEEARDDFLQALTIALE